MEYSTCMLDFNYLPCNNPFDTFHSSFNQEPSMDDLLQYFSTPDYSLELSDPYASNLWDDAAAQTYGKEVQEAEEHEQEQRSPTVTPHRIELTDSEDSSLEPPSPDYAQECSRNQNSNRRKRTTPNSDDYDHDAMPARKRSRRKSPEQEPKSRRQFLPSPAKRMLHTFL